MTQDGQSPSRYTRTLKSPLATGDDVRRMNTFDTNAENPLMKKMKSVSARVTKLDNVKRSSPQALREYTDLYQVQDPQNDN